MQAALFLNRARVHAHVQHATIVFFPEGAYGPTNNCVGIGQVLRDRGHRVVFIIEASFAGNLEAQGFEERVMRLGPPPDVEEEPGQFWKDFIRDTSPIFREPTIDQLSEFIEPTWRALCDGAAYVDDRLREIFDELQPNVIVQDNVVGFPAIHHSGKPWVRIVSCNPLEVKDDAIPPVFSGYPAGDTIGWDAFRYEYLRTTTELHGAFSSLFVERGAQELPAGEFIHESEWLNLYLYPAALDYERSKPLAPTWHRLETCVRRSDSQFELPERIARARSGLVYLSLGSLGSADVELMKRLVEVLSRSRQRFIVSKGPQHDEFELADNMWGEEFLPQPAVLPLVDAVITHAGNNTTTECFHFGKPMVALPLFWDQYDNAQRVAETGFGFRLATYAFEESELLTAIDTLLGNSDLSTRMAAIAADMQASPGTAKAADLIERLAREATPILR
jgi:MGT family glycosyltransferase